MMQRQPQIEILKRDLEMLREDIHTHKDHMMRITCAAERLAEAIKILAKGSTAPKQTRNV
jgi:hypothetical protein